MGVSSLGEYVVGEVVSCTGGSGEELAEGRAVEELGCELTRGVGMTRRSGLYLPGFGKRAKGWSIG